MKLIVHELEGAGLTQEVVCQRNIILKAIRPHIYRHNFPTGTLKLEVRDGSSTLIATSDDVDIADIATMDFFHGYVRFDIDAYLKKDETYSIKLVGDGGYTFDESAYIGWCNGYDLGKYDPSTTPNSKFQYPLDLEVWERTEK